MSDNTIAVLDGSTFVVADRCGDVRADEGCEHGFFAHDTRFVSRWVLGVADTTLSLLSLDQGEHFFAQFFLTPRVAPDDQAGFSVVRRRLLDWAWMAAVPVTNHRHEPSRLHLTLEVAADFADLFEVKEGAVAARDVACTFDEQSLILSYECGDFRRSVTITASRPTIVGPAGFAYTLELGPGERWSTSFTIDPHAAQAGVVLSGSPAKGGDSTRCAEPSRPSCRDGSPGRPCCAATIPC